MGSLKFSNALLCEDVRQEANGKLMLIGVYTGGIIFDSLPASKESLLVFASASFPKGETKIRHRLRKSNSKKTLLEGQGVMEAGSENTLEENEVFFPIPLSHAEFRESGSYCVELKINDARWKKLVSFTVSEKASE